VDLRGGHRLNVSFCIASHDFIARMMGVTSVPRSSIGRFIAAVSSDALLIWNVMRARLSDDISLDELAVSIGSWRVTRLRRSQML
jgi:hypothetical protein